MVIKNLLVDAGGTNMRCALSGPEGISEHIEYKCAEFSSPAAVIQRYLDTQGIESVERAVIAVAGASEDPSKVVFTNGPWAQTPLDFTEIAADKVETMNDFAAVCYSIATFSEADCTSLINNHAAPFFPGSILATATPKANPSRISRVRPEHRFVAVGAGTGLGVGSGMVTDTNQFLVLDGEGGHIAFAPRDKEEFALKEYLQDRGTIVTAETIASGMGLVTTFNTICKIRGIDCEIKDGSEVAKKLGDSNADIQAVAHKTLEIFASTLGSAAASAALTNKAHTVFISSNIIQKMGLHFNAMAFATSFGRNDLGENNILLETPVMFITHKQPGLAGAGAYLELTAA